MHSYSMQISPEIIIFSVRKLGLILAKLQSVLRPFLFLYIVYKISIAKTMQMQYRENNY